MNQNSLGLGLRNMRWLRGSDKGILIWLSPSPQIPLAVKWLGDSLSRDSLLDYKQHTPVVHNPSWPASHKLTQEHYCPPLDTVTLPWAGRFWVWVLVFWGHTAPSLAPCRKKGGGKGEREWRNQVRSNWGWTGATLRVSKWEAEAWKGLYLSSKAASRRASRMFSSGSHVLYLKEIRICRQLFLSLRNESAQLRRLATHSSSQLAVLIDMSFRSFFLSFHFFANEHVKLASKFEGNRSMAMCPSEPSTATSTWKHATICFCEKASEFLLN